MSQVRTGVLGESECHSGGRVFRVRMGVIGEDGCSG